MSVDSNLHQEALDWNKAAEYVLSAEAIAKREHAGALIKFDGERTNGKIYTVLLDGFRGQDLFFRMDTSDLLGTLAKAYPFGDDATFDVAQTARLSHLLSEWDRWVRKGFVLSLNFAWVDGAMSYSAIISGEHGVFEHIHVEGKSILEVMSNATGQLEAR
ncbi:hypothetical protein FIV34_11235 [Luteibacter pinisoli]|uniref:Uncharacterized protein n=1 Tax=Luteibacter pinisoli TaxID=2589080 RepID=A0A4Y5Z3N1_9GAMM|nr:hypothetical protein [Luteibacter pinisoli]QDE39737.1 hypothetical protein FIV34_11235 [Luteibacter pinisoli]